jgi:hypothetical protein
LRKARRWKNWNAPNGGLVGLNDIANKLRVTSGKWQGPLLKKLYDRLQQMNITDRRMDDDGWHISSIPYLCPRELALRSLFPKPVEADHWEPRALMRVDVGSAVHGWWQNQYLGPANILFGNWACRGKCQKRWIESLMPGRRCNDCGGVVEFTELQVRDDATRICGSTDGILMLGGERWGFDLKTSTEDSMARIKEPYEGHIWQLNLYMHLLGVNKGLIVYVDPVCRFWREKNGTGLESLPVLEFRVDYDRKWWDKAVEVTKAAQKIKDEIKAGTWDGVLPSQICENPSVFRAKDCPVAAECFTMGVDARVKELAAKKV